MDESDPLWLDDQSGCNDRHVDGFGGMSRAQDFCARTPADIVFENDVSGVKIGLWANPDVIADSACSIETTLDHGLGTDENGVPKLHGFRMLQHNARSNLKIVPDGLTESAHRNPPHHTVEDP